MGIEWRPWRKNFWTGQEGGINLGGFAEDVIMGDIYSGEGLSSGLGRGVNKVIGPVTEPIMDLIDPTDDFKPLQDAYEQSIDLQRDIWGQTQQNLAPWIERGQNIARELPDMADRIYDVPLPGKSSPYQMMDAPDMSQYGPGMAPEYRGWNPSFTPERWGPTQAPTQTPYNVNLGRGMGMYSPGQVDPGGVYNVRGADTGGMYQRGDFNFEADPGYQFRKEAGLEALQRQAARQGGRDSGRTFKDESRFLQGLASEEYGAAHQRHMAEEAAKQAAFESGAGRGLQAYGLEEPLRQGAYESGAGRGLQAYGLREPLASQAYESAAQRGMTRDLRGAELGLQAYEGAKGREADIWGQQQGFDLAGLQAYQDPMMQLQGMQQDESQFGGQYGLDRYATEGQLLGQQGDRQLDLYQSQLPFDYQSWQYMQDDPWRRFGAEYGREADYYNRMANISGQGLGAATGMGDIGQQAGAGMSQALLGLGQTGAARSQAPWNMFMDLIGAGTNIAGAFGGRKR